MFELQIQGCVTQEVLALSEQLVTYGAVAVTLTDQFDSPIFEPELDHCTLWPDVVITALFDNEDKAHLAKILLLDNAHDIKCQFTPVVTKDWQQQYLKYLKPQTFGQKLCICPSHYQVLVLDPGLAFGSGTHPTTSLCLESFTRLTLADKRVLDYGCGSGILAIASVLLGAGHAHAVDIDEQALLATKVNAQKNHLSERQLSVGYPESAQKPVDIIVANILFSPLMELKERFKMLLNPGGVLLISGVLDTQKAALIAEYSDVFSLVSTEVLHDWVFMHFTPKQN